MFGTRRPCTREQLTKDLRLSVEFLDHEAARLERRAAQAEHLLDTIITNLRKGAAPAQILEWWDKDGKRTLDTCEPPAAEGGRDGG